MAHAAPQRRWLLAAAASVLLVLSVLPSRWGMWANWLGARAEMIIAPVTRPIYSLVAWIAPREPARPEIVARLEEERDRWKQQYRNLEREHADLRSKVEKEFGSGALPESQPQRRLLRQVIGTSADPGGQMSVRAGARDGVEKNAVATTEGVQLVGKVVEVGPRTCWVRLITDISGGSIDGVIMTTDTVRGPRANALHAVIGRKLQGLVRVEKDQQTPEAGQDVLLDDPRWPRSSQMLVIGTVAERPVQLATGWYQLTVKPTVELEHLSEVVLRFSPAEPDEKTPPTSTDGTKP